MKEAPKRTRRYTAKCGTVTGPMTGASSGYLSPGKLAEEVLGALNWGETTAYMMRRFGLPNLPSDSYNEVARWMITTPIDGLFLTFVSRPHDTNLLFGYMVTHELDRQMGELRHAHSIAEREAYVAWSVSTTGAPPPGFEEAEPSTPEETQAALNRLLAVDKTPEERAALWAAQSAAYNAYEASDPAPVPAPEGLVEIEDAVRATLRDLLRTVGVRDCEISIKGAGEHHDGVHYSDDASKVPVECTKHPEFTHVLMAIIKRGGGLKGLRKLNKDLAKLDAQNENAS